MKIDKINKLKQKGAIDEAFEKKYPIETRLIKILTNSENEKRPVSSKIKELPEYQEWKREFEVFERQLALKPPPPQPAQSILSTTPPSTTV